MCADKIGLAGRTGGCREILTGGGDGYIKVWQINAAGGLGVCSRTVGLVHKGVEGPVAAPMVRSAAVADGSGSVVVGTAACDIWKVYPDNTAQVLLFGHHGHVVGLATNPNPDYAHIFATCSSSNKIALWSIATNKVLLASNMYRSCVISRVTLELCIFKATFMYFP